MDGKNETGPVKVEVLGTGDELLRGRSRDLNFSVLAGHIIEAGHEVVGGRIVGDDPAAVTGAIREAAARADAVVVTGGLGPTADDVTRDAAAGILGVPLVLHKYSRRIIRSSWLKRGLPAPEGSLRQAHIPRGANFLFNRIGTAQGFSFRLGNAEVYCLPGPPREAEVMLLESVVPALRALAKGPLRNLTLHVSCCGTSEGAVGERIHDLMARGLPVRVGTTVSEGVVTISVHGTGRASRMVRMVHRTVLDRLGADVYAADRVRPGENLLRLLIARGLTVAAAESCTGGIVSTRLTDAPGSSKAFLGGVTAYANEVKEKVLGVPGRLLRGKGAVSGPVAEAMAEGIRKLTGADLGVGVTGVAGPVARKRPRSPVGHVWFAVADRSGVRSFERYIAGDRAFVRSVAGNLAIDLIRRAVDRPASPQGPRQGKDAQGTGPRAQG
jgi:nicotinamide-nucleotide amidase